MHLARRTLATPWYEVRGCDQSDDLNDRIDQTDEYEPTDRKKKRTE